MLRSRSVDAAGATADAGGETPLEGDDDTEAPPALPDKAAWQAVFASPKAGHLYNFTTLSFDVTLTGDTFKAGNTSDTACA